MRIGVHTGKIISGIIGAVKYQFDIWSRDVDIANKMESEGSAGWVVLEIVIQFTFVIYLILRNKYNKYLLYIEQ